MSHDAIVYLVEIVAALPGTGVNLNTLYYSSTPGYVTASGDTPSHTAYEERLINPGSFSRSLFGSRRISGQTQVGIGEIILNNADGGLDNLTTYGFDGRTVTIKRGTPSTDLSGFVTVFSGTIEQALFDFTEVRLQLRDAQAEVASLELTTEKFAGTNSGSTGVEGLPEDLKGRFKPVLYGAVEGISPPLVNSSSLTYQISNAAIDNISAVYDSGAALTPGTNHGTLAAFLASSPGSSTYDYYLGSEGSYFRLGSSPAGIVTCDAEEGTTTPFERTAAQIAERILMGPGGLASGSIDLASVSSLDALNSSEVGIWAGPEGMRIGTVLDAVLQSIGGYWTVDRSGIFSFGRLDLPDGTGEAAILTESEIIDDIEKLRLDAELGGIPSWRVTTQYRYNFTVLSPAELAGSVTLARTNLVGQEWRTVNSDDADILLKHPLSPEKTFPTYLTAESDAQDEADRLFTIFGNFIEILAFSLAAEYSELIDLASTITIDIDRFGLSGGVNFRVISIEEDFSEGVIEIEAFRVF